MSAQIHTWFPQSVYQIDDLLKDGLADLEAAVRDQAEKSGMIINDQLAVPSTHRTNNQLHTLAAFQDIAWTVMDHAAVFLRELGYIDEFIDNCRIANMWANISGPGHYIFPHVHSNSVLSGAYYVKKSPGAKLRFYSNLTSMVAKPQIYNMLNYEYCDYDCEPGRLLLFRSDFLHGTQAQTEGEKIVISFNIEHHGH